MPLRSRLNWAVSPAANGDVVEAGVRPPLKWAGGKRWQLPHLVPFWMQAEGARLVEPFCGGLAVTLGLMPHRAVLNDMNPHLMGSGNN